MERIVSQQLRILHGAPATRLDQNLPGPFSTFTTNTQNTRTQLFDIGFTDPELLKVELIHNSLSILRLTVLRR